MLYWIYQHFDINILHYISVRSIIGFFIAFLFTLFMMPKYIKWAQNKTQPIYDLAPESHKQKAKTPTMGGVVFIFSSIIAILISADLGNEYVFISIFTMISFMLIGLKDDLGKINGGDNQAGLTPKQKLIFQWSIAFGIAFVFYMVGLDTHFYIPFYKYPLFDMGIGAIPFWALVFVATSNAVNLTDGLDGLATVPSIFALFTFAIITYITGNVIFSDYLFLPYVQGISEDVIVAISLIGALIGFLWFNSNPAEVFMGDSGSLSIGGVLAMFAIITKNELLLILIGFIFVMETVSVILQVGSFKTRGKRIFKMAPIHHHFEMVGWKENKVTVRFWIIALISNILALITLKIR